VLLLSLCLASFSAIFLTPLGFHFLCCLGVVTTGGTCSCFFGHCWHVAFYSQTEYISHKLLRQFRGVVRLSGH
jgi:hypothetical protein